MLLHVLFIASEKNIRKCHTTWPKNYLIAMRKPAILFGILLLFFTACNSDDTNNGAETVLLNAEVENFLDEVLSIMESNSINREDINWESFRNQVKTRAANAQSIADTDAALTLALQLLNDNHSFIRKENGSVLSASTANCQAEEVNAVDIPDNIGYLRVPFFSGSDFQETRNFATDLQSQIRDQDQSALEGWIVDLRGNAGGNMWPMLAGVGPILGEGIAGYFVGPDNSQVPWSYTNGASVLGQNAIVLLPAPYELINPNPKVAVLLDRAVVSSGEAIAVAFEGRENTKSFGSATCGLSTANRGFQLSDGTLLLLTTDYFADRDLNIFGVPIEPDVPADNENLIDLAVEYILN